MFCLVLVIFVIYVNTINLYSYHAFLCQCCVGQTHFYMSEVSLHMIKFLDIMYLCVCLILYVCIYADIKEYNYYTRNLPSDITDPQVAEHLSERPG